MSVCVCRELAAGLQYDKDKALELLPQRFWLGRDELSAARHFTGIREADARYRGILMAGD